MQHYSSSVSLYYRVALLIVCMENRGGFDKEQETTEDG